MRNTCFGLMRFCGMIGFLVLGLGVLMQAPKWLGISPDFLFVNQLKGKALFAFLLATGAGLVGLVIGQVIGASIPVRSEKLDAFITLVWHGTANGTIVWFMVSMGALGISLGGEELKDFSLAFGVWKFSLVVAAIGSGAGIITALAYFGLGTGLAHRGSEGLAAILPWIVAIPAGMFAGAALAVVVGRGIIPLLLAGAFQPFLTILLVNWTLTRDNELRQRAQSGGSED